MPKRKGVILFVEDAEALREPIAMGIRRRGYEVLATEKPDKAIDWINENEHIDAAVFDLQLPVDGSKYISGTESDGGNIAGVILAQEFRRKFPTSPIIFWTTAYRKDLRTHMRNIGNTTLIAKSDDADPLFDTLDEALDGFSSGTRPRVFIVHGHDENTMQSVKTHLENEFGFKNPVVLRDQPNYGQTIIEKLESYTHAVDVVLVLLTPDDRVLSKNSEQDLGRSRQNVIFEMGYFMGALGRSMGRVILLYKQPVELPSDIEGMIKIDITAGLNTADRELRSELQEWL